VQLDLFLGTGIMQCSVQEVQEKQYKAKHELQTLAEQQSLFIFTSMLCFHFLLT